jgi:hypothetical protein
LDEAGNDDTDDPDKEDAYQCYPEGGPPVERTALLEKFGLSPLDDQGEYYPDYDDGYDHYDQPVEEVATGHLCEY